MGALTARYHFLFHSAKGLILEAIALIALVTAIWAGDVYPNRYNQYIRGSSKDNYAYNICVWTRILHSCRWLSLPERCGELRMIEII